MPANESEDTPRGRKGHGRTTLADVALAAGVTKITVSRYLREPAKVAPATAARIAAALAEHAYVPNKQAGMLASGRSRVVAAIVPSLANSVFAETIQGLAEGLQTVGFELLLASSGYSQQREEEQIRAVLGWSPDALAVTGRHHTPAALALMKAAVAAGTPIIEMWDRQPRNAAFVQVGFDHAEVGRAMARHLLEAGHRRLVYADTGVAADFRAHERGKAFVAAAKQAGASARVVTAPEGDAFDAGRAVLAALLDARGRLGADALACANDHLACGAWLEAQARGIKVPGQLALIGFGDFALARQLGGGISTVHPPRYEIGRETAAMMLRLMAPTAAAQAIEAKDVPWQLVPRGSTERVKSARRGAKD
jgi:LacI family transcriptional regulator, gluconate utilization system Gnt-I transcriptional repressor